MRSPEASPASENRLRWVAFALISLLLILGTRAFYRYQSSKEVQRQHQLISGIGSLNLKQITSWREDRLSSVQRMVKGPLFRWRAEDFHRNPNSAKARGDLLQVLQVSKMGKRYLSAFLVSLDGHLLVTTDPIPQPFDPATQRIIAAVQSGPESGFSEFFQDAEGNPRIDAAALVRGAEDQPLAVALLRIDAEASLFSLYKQWPIPTRTAESALVTRSGNEAVTPQALRHEAAGVPRWHRPLTETSFPAVKVVLGARGLHEGIDYRGKVVLADLQAIPGSPWFLITKVDKEEALAPLRRESALIGSLTLALILLTGAGMAFHFRHREAATFRKLLEQEQSLRTSEHERSLQAVALEQSERRFQELVASTDGILWEADATTFAFTYISPNAERLLGYPGEAWLNAGFWADHLHPEDQEQAISYCVACTGRLEDHDFEYRFLAKDGRTVWLRDIVHVVSEGGRPRWLRGLMVDITTQKQAEEERLHLQAQLQQSQKMESLGSLAGGVAHDMNNVLGAILGLASANLSLQSPGTPLHRTFETITKAANRGAKLVQSLLAFARQSPAEMQEVDLNAILREEVHLLERTTLAQVKLQLDLAEDLRLIQGDPAALSHTLMNLCVNAVDAMPEQGTLTLRTRNLDPDQVELTVADTGSGMSKAVLDRALDPFFTTKPQGKGTGLGLSMAYRTVKAHLGTLEIESEPDHGTRIILRFPACEARPASPTPEVGTSAAPAPARLSVLLVDDDELIQQSMLSLLEALGHTPKLAPSGEAALALLEGGYRPQVVILDMNMPGWGGTGTLPRLRKLCPTMPVILATGRADQAALDLVRAHRQVILLPKPFEIEVLRHQLESLRPA